MDFHFKVLYILLRKYYQFDFTHFGVLCIQECISAYFNIERCPVCMCSKIPLKKIPLLWGIYCSEKFHMWEIAVIIICQPWQRFEVLTLLSVSSV